MRDLVYEFMQLTRHNKDGSFATQADRRHMLTLIAEQLYDLGFTQLHAHTLKGRHINRLLALWQQQGITTGTIHNRLSALRWACSKLNRQAIIPKTNTPYGLDPRQRIPQTSRAKALSDDRLARITDPLVRMSLQLQQAWGLRRAESILVRPHQADLGAALLVRDTSAKGGRERTIPLMLPQQRATLDAAKALAPTRDAALIPRASSFIQQRRRYDYQCRKVGLSAMHGLRHHFAQDLYQHLTGFEAPAAGGPERASLTPAEETADEAARAIISEQLGHGRLTITKVYLDVMPR